AGRSASGWRPRRSPAPRQALTAASIDAPPSSCTSAHGWKSPGPSDLAEPLSAGLRTTSEGLPVDRDHAELRAVSEGPLEVVEKAPIEVAPYLDSCRQTGQHL